MLARQIAAMILLAPLAGALGGCCCCPPLSCRYGQPGCPHAPPMGNADCGCGGGGCGCGAISGHGITGHGGAGHFPLLAHAPWLHEPVVSKQHYDYVSPPLKYHPVPTRPVFEPQPEYPPAHALAGPAPRRVFLHEGHRLPLHQQQSPRYYDQPASGPAEPTPAQPQS